MTVNVAIIGAGRMGQTHFNNLHKLTGVSVSHVYDPRFSAQQKAAFKGTTLCSTLAQVSGNSSIDAVVITAPSTNHAELIEVFANSCKHIFCEKPVSFDLDTLQRLQGLTKRQNIICQVGFNRRYDPGIRKIRDQIASGIIGDIQLIKIVNRDPKRADHHFVKNSGGLFFDFNVHDFDTINFLSNQAIAEIHAQGDALVDPDLKALGDIDTAFISLKLKSGTLAVIDCSRETGYGYDQQVEVLGSKGMLRLRNQRESETFKRSAMSTNVASIPYSFVERYQESYLLQFEEFFSCIKNRAQPSTGIDAAIYAVNAAHMATKSFEQQRNVVN